MNDFVLKIDNLSKCFNQKHDVLCNITQTFYSGEIISIQGDNGSGKTTLLRILATLIFPSKGQIYLDNIPYNIVEKKFRHLIGWMPSSSIGFYSRLSGLENIHYFSSFYHLDHKYLNDLISKWKTNSLFSEALNQKFFLCSTGMKNILLLFKAFMHQPKLVLLDEPLASFDKDASVFAIDMIKVNRQDKITIFTSHQETDVQKLATKTLHLKGGMLV